MGDMANNLHNPATLLPPRKLSKNVDCTWTASSYSQSDGKGTLYNLREQGSTTGQLILATKGMGFFRSAENKWILAEPGDLFYYEPRAYQEYGDILTSRWEYHWVHFFPKPQWKSWLRLPLPCGIPGLHKAAFKSKKQKATAVSLFQDIHRHLRHDGPWHLERALNLLEGILLFANQSSAQSQPDERIRIALEAIASDPYRNFSVEALAKNSGLSPSRFSHLFKQETGLSVIQYVIQTKLYEARNLLANSSKSISEIAAILGLASGEYLSILFKRRFGVSPSQFRHGGKKGISQFNV